MMVFATSPWRNCASETLIDSVEMLRPFGRGGERVANDPLAERLDEPAFVGDRHERGRQQLAELRMVHAHERLEAGEPARAQVVLRLEMQLEPALLQAVADRLFHLQARLDRHLHLARIDAERVAAGLLGGIAARARRCAAAWRASPPWSGATAMPMLAPGRAWRGTWAQASFTVSWMRRAKISAWRAPPASGWMMANSSSPIRARRSGWLTRTSSRSVTSAEKVVALGLAAHFVDDVEAVDVDEVDGELPAGLGVRLELRGERRQKFLPAGEVGDRRARSSASARSRLFATGCAGSRIGQAGDRDRRAGCADRSAARHSECRRTIGLLDSVCSPISVIVSA